MAIVFLQINACGLRTRSFGDVSVLVLFVGGGGGVCCVLARVFHLFHWPHIQILLNVLHVDFDAWTYA